MYARYAVIMEQTKSILKNVRKVIYKLKRLNHYIEGMKYMPQWLL